ncbi:hypothetical protein ACLIBH_12315 [Virgibacillus sp. W0430]
MDFIVKYEIVILSCCIISCLVGVQVGEYLSKKQTKKLIEQVLKNDNKI